MANERTYPCLPCGDIDQAIAFYESLGFRRTYRQLRPNPYAVVAREDIHIHLFGMENFDPVNSYGSVIVVVPDVDELYQAFSAGLRTAYGKLPTVGIPRILRPRKKFGTVRGFSVVDVGGNWLRISQTNEKETKENAAGLMGFIEVAARLGDAHGDEVQALKTIENGLERFPDASAVDRVRAHLYRAELAVRLNQQELAQLSLSTALGIKLDAKEQASVASEIDQTAELVHDSF